MWTQFMDMHSGGGQKLDWAYIYIEASEEEAKVIFQNRFGRNPNRVTCTCCGSDYSISEARTFGQVCGYERNCKWNDGSEKYTEKKGDSYRDYQTVAQYKQDKHILIIPKEEIKPEEREGELTEEGYVWR